MNTRKVARVCYDASRAAAGGGSIPPWESASTGEQESFIAMVERQIANKAATPAKGVSDLSAAIISVFVQPEPATTPEPKVAVEKLKGKLIGRLKRK